MTDAGPIDFAAIFDALPTPYLILDPQLRIVAANRARGLATSRSADVVGQHLFEAFPDDPADPDARATTLLGESLRRVLETGEPDAMPIQRYNIPAPAGGFERRWWSPVNAPVLDRECQVRFIVHRAEDVTEYMRTQDDGTELAASDAAERDAYTQGNALRDSLTKETTSARRLAALVGVARELGRTTTVAELTDVVVRRVSNVLDADAGAVAVLAPGGDVLELTLTDAFRDLAEQELDLLPIDSRLPAAVCAATGEPVILPDAAASTAWSPQLAELVARTGLSAWASYPLRVQASVLGTLTIGWREAQTFPGRDTSLLTAFAALCAQALDRIQRRLLEERTISAERGLSEALQRSLLTDPAQPDHIQVAVRYRPAAEHARVGGDWYDAYLVPAGLLTIVIGDVAGHDRQAAVAMAQLRNLMRGISVTLQEPPAAVLGALDRALHTLSVAAIATALVAQVEQTAAQESRGVRTLRWSSAGHYAPLLLRPDGTSEFLRTEPDLLLGVEPDAERRDHEVELPPGSMVVLYTDGLIERRGVPVQQGLDWLAATVRGQHGLSAEALCDRLLDAADWAHEDDIAILVLAAD